MQNDKLEALAQAAGIERYQVPSRLALSAIPPPSAADATATQTLLAEARKRSGTYRDPGEKFSRHFKSRTTLGRLQDPTTWVFSQEELDVGLDTAISDNSPLGIVGDLLRRGARPKHEQHLVIAVRRWDAHLATLLLQHFRGRKPETPGTALQQAPVQQALDKALEQALDSITSPLRDEASSRTALATVSCLVAGGASVQTCRLSKTGALQHLTRQGNTAMVHLLLRSQMDISAGTMSSCLSTAVDRNHIALVRTFLAYGGDPNYDNGAAVVRASVNVRYKISVAVLSLTKHRVNQSNLASALDGALLAAAPNDHNRWLKLFLCVGIDPKTPCLTNRLTKAVEQRDSEIIDLLLSHRIPTTADSYGPIRAGILSGDATLTTKLIDAGWYGTRTRELDQLIPLLSRKFGEEDEIMLTRLLLEKGAKGSGIYERLVSLVSNILVKRKDKRSSKIEASHVELLVKGGDAIGVEQYGAEALQLALDAGNIFLVQQLCEMPLSSSKTSSAFRGVFLSSSNATDQAKVDLATALLKQRSVSQSTKDEVLESVLSRGRHNLNLIRWLAENGARAIGTDHGFSLQQALALCSDEVFDVLLGTVDRNHAAVGAALELSLSQLSKSRLLLQHGCPQSAIDDALSTEMQNQPPRGPVLDTLLDYRADVNQYGGALLALACARGDPDTVLHLLRAAPSQQSLGRGLRAASEASFNQAIFSFLFQHGASPDYEDGEALIHAVNKTNVEAVQTIVDRNPRQDILMSALLDAMDLATPERCRFLSILLAKIDAIAQQDTLDMVLSRAITELDERTTATLLDHHRVPGSKAVHAFTQAALEGEELMVGMLIPRFNDPSICSIAMESMSQEPDSLRGNNGTAVARLLLAQPIAQKCRDLVLLSAVQDAVSGRPSQELIDNCLRTGSTPNADDGKALSLSAAQSSPELFLRLLRHNPSSKSLGNALPHLLRAGLSADDVLRAFEACHTEDKVFEERVTGDNIVMLALEHYPHGHKLLLKAFEYGYNYPKHVPLTIFAEAGPERATVLVWAIESRVHISLQVTSLLLEGNAALGQRSSSATETTALLSALKFDRMDIAAHLLEKGSSIESTDSRGKTPLWYASAAMSPSMVDKLCSMGASKNDGTLHEAARLLQPALVKRLMAADHDPDYPSPLHEGRSALLEMLLNANVSTASDRRIVIQIHAMLRAIDTDPTITFRGKNAIFCALDNPHPVPVTQAFLDTDEWKSLNAEHNLYCGHDQTCYSPTMYIERGPWPGQTSDRARLLSILRNKRCKDRFYTLNGEQPAGAVGLPQYLAEAERERQTELRRMASITNEHNTRLLQQRQSHAVALEGVQQQHALTVQQERERRTEQRQASADAHRLQMDQDRQHALARSATQKNENHAALAHQSKLIEMRQAEDETRVSRERQLQREGEERQERQYRREMQRVDHALASERSRIQLAAAAQRELLAYQATPLQITQTGHNYDEPD